MASCDLSAISCDLMRSHIFTIAYDLIAIAFSSHFSFSLLSNVRAPKSKKVLGVKIVKELISIPIVREKREILMTVTNTYPRSIKLYKGSKITTLMPVQVTHLLHKDKSLEEQIEEIDFNKNCNLSPTQKLAVKDLLYKHTQIMAKNTISPGFNLRVKHVIDTGDSLPIRTKLRRSSPLEDKIIKEEVEKMLANGVIRKSKSPWAAPVVLVTKKDGSIRFCVDFRKLNAVTKKDRYPLPHAEVLMNKLRGMKCFTGIDLASGYWQVEIKEEDKEKTAFICSEGLFEFNCMPFGLANAPATFQRMMNEVMSNGKWHVGEDFMDDILIGSPTFEDHVKDLTQLFEIFAKYGLKIKLSKCQFFKEELAYLGHVVNQSGVKPDPKKITAITKMEKPEDVSALRRFLGMASYYRKFVKNFSSIAQPLFKLLEKDSVYKWNEDCQVAMDTIKEKLTSEPILRHPDFNREFTIQTDASYQGLGAVITQVDNNGNEYVVAYASRTLSKAERNYATTVLEGQAIMWATKYFRHYIYGNHFTVLTDHKPLTTLTTKESDNAQLRKISMHIQQYGDKITINYREGKQNVVADALSRAPVSEILMIKRNLQRTFLNVEKDKWKTWIEAQRNDTELSNIIDYIEKQELPEDEADKVIALAANCDVIEGMLIRSVVNSKRNEFMYQIMVPKTLITQVLEDNHNQLTAGHMGIRRTYERIRSKFYWPGIYKDVKNWVKACKDCGARKGSPIAHMGEAGSVVATEVNDIIGVDYMVNLPVTVNGYKNILVIIDLFSKWVEVVPTKNVDAKTTAMALYQYFSRYGAPKKLLSDRGTSFLNDTIKELSTLFGVHKVNTTPYHPQTNGLTERFNKTITEILSMYVGKSHKDWDEYLPSAVMAYNSSVHSVNNETPAYLTFGRDIRLPTDLIIPMHANDNIKQFKEDLVRRIAEACESALKLSNLARMKTQTDQNKKNRSNQFKEGDLVWLHRPKIDTGKTKKLFPRWEGPYRIAKFTSPVVVQLANRRGLPLKNLYNISKLKPYHTPKKFAWEKKKKGEDEVAMIEDDPNQTWEVDRIVAWRLNDQDEKEYKVKWKGFTSHDNTWEPLDFLQNAKEAILDFEKELTCNHCGKLTENKSDYKKHREQCD